MVRIPVLLLALATLGLSGCFVLDELDAGREIMEENAPKTSEEAAAAKAKAAGGEDPKAPPSRQEWWSKARSLNRSPDSGDSSDPKAMVSCRLAGSTRFMRRQDCLSQGGRAG